MVKKIFLQLILETKKFSGWAPILVKFTGKSQQAIHPKHLVKFEQPWFAGRLKKTDCVLDIGCGNGQNTLKAAKKCRKIIGIDNNKKQLLIAKTQAKKRKIKNAVFLSFDAEKKLEFKKGRFDTILFLDVLEHLRKRKQILKEIYRVLKKKGSLFVAIPNKNTTWKKSLRKEGLSSFAASDHKIEYSKKEIEKELNKTGFKIIKVMPIIYDYRLVGIVDIIGGFSLKAYKKINKWRIKKVKSKPEETTGFRIICKK